jgi:tripartite-type tricarboxylate transporter receptor subunit TctC
MKFTTFASGLALAAALSFASAGGVAADYPDRPITLVVAFAAGGTTDIIARIAAEPLSQRLGQPIVIDNRPGAGGRAGTLHASTLPADGYHLATASTGTHAISILVHPDIGYDPREDFVYVGLIAETPYVMAVRTDSQFQSVQEVIDYAQENPGELNFGTAGVGSATHLAAELFLDMADVDMEHIPYDGSAPSSAALVGGEIDILFASFPGVIGHVINEEARVLGVGSLRRAPQVPDVPTMDEIGLTGYEATLWVGYSAPAGVPDEFIERLHAELTDIVENDEEVRQRLIDNGAAPVTSESPQAMMDLVHSSVELYRPIVERIGVGQ